MSALSSEEALPLAKGNELMLGLVDIRRELNDLLPISKLPAEILAQIFEQHVSHFSSGNPGWFPIVMHTCHRWRAVAIGTSSLWRRIFVGEHTDPGRILLWITNAKANKLILSLTILSTQPPNHTYQEALDVALSLVHRTERLAMTIHPYYVGPVPWPSSPSSTVQHVTLQCSRHKPKDCRHYLSRDIYLCDISVIFPSLRRLSLVWCKTIFLALDLPQSLVSLRVSGCSPYLKDLHYLVRTVSKLCQLRILDVSASIPEVSWKGDHPRWGTPRALCETLRHFKLGGSVDLCAAMLQMVVLPITLSTLSLQCILSAESSPAETGEAVEDNLDPLVRTVFARDFDRLFPSLQGLVVFPSRSSEFLCDKGLRCTRSGNMSLVGWERMLPFKPEGPSSIADALDRRGHGKRLSVTLCHAHGYTSEGLPVMQPIDMVGQFLRHLPLSTVTVVYLKTPHDVTSFPLLPIYDDMGNVQELHIEGSGDSRPHDLGGVCMDSLRGTARDPKPLPSLQVLSLRYMYFSYRSLRELQQVLESRSLSQSEMTVIISDSLGIRSSHLHCLKRVTAVVWDGKGQVQ